MGSYSHAVANGTDSTPGYGQKENIVFAQTWVAGDTWFLDFVASNGSFSIGAATDSDGAVILVGSNPTNGLVLKERVYLAAGSKFLFSDNNDPTGWYQQNPGAGWISLLSQYGGQDSITALASYQGYVAAFLRNSIQIWFVDADPVNFSQKQVLSNIGTAYGFSVQSLGDWDVLFLADSGVRSLRVRDSSLNAVTTDIGSPIDSLTQTVMQAGNAGTPLSIVEPTNNRYWLYMNGTIYVLSYFTDSKIRAWSTYKPTTWGMTLIAAPYGALTIGLSYRWIPVGGGGVLTVGATDYAVDTTFVAAAAVVPVVKSGAGALYVYESITFVPSKFVVYAGKVYARVTATIEGVVGDYLVSYGGGYDACVATMQSPFLSLKSPSTNKYAKGLDLAITGAWAVSVSMDQASGTFETVGSMTGPTFDGGVVALQAAGTHMAFKLVSSGATAALLSSFSLSFDMGELQ